MNGMAQLILRRYINVIYHVYKIPHASFRSVNARKNIFIIEETMHAMELCSPAFTQLPFFLHGYYIMHGAHWKN